MRLCLYGRADGRVEAVRTGFQASTSLFVSFLQCTRACTSIRTRVEQV
jgi:hypothetical protein